MIVHYSSRIVALLLFMLIPALSHASLIHNIFVDNALVGTISFPTESGVLLNCDLNPASCRGFDFTFDVPGTIPLMRFTQDNVYRVEWTVDVNWLLSSLDLDADDAFSPVLGCIDACDLGMHGDLLIVSTRDPDFHLFTPFTTSPMHAPVPAPATLGLLSLGLAALGLSQRKRHKQPTS